MAKVKLGNVKGPKGEQGVRGSKWYNTDKITGESTSGTAFPESGIADAMVGDMALNPTTLNLYTCQTAGNAATAKWVFMACIKGPQGEQGPKGDPTTVDAVLSKDSTNPIQNKAVATKIQDVEDSLGRAHIFRDVLSSGDANNIQPGIYLVGSESVKNLPSGSAYSVLIDFGGIGGGCNDQILFNSDGKFMVRGFGGGRWSPWVSV